MQEKDLIKYIRGETNPKEKKHFIDWIREDEEHQKLFSILKAKYVASTLDSVDTSDVNIPYRRFASKKRKKRKYYYAAALASILLPLMIWYVYPYFQENNLFINNITDSFELDSRSIFTKHGDHKTVVLPDGSVVVLNSDSRLTYPEKFSDNYRMVTLVGEAFFDIKRNVSKPFIVNTDHVNIKVLGTSFNIKSYPKDEKIETTLVTGQVEIIQQRTAEAIVLTPSQRATYSKKIRDIIVDEVDSKKIVAWQEGKLIFDNTSLKQIALDLNRKYNKEFVIKSDSLLRYKYTGEFDNLTLEEVLNLLKFSSPINYKYVKNKVILYSE